MNRNEIIRMAKEAGISPMRGRVGDDFMDVMWPDLERFAALVAAAERNGCVKVVEEALKDIHPGNGKTYGALKWVWRHMQNRALP